MCVDKCQTLKKRLMYMVELTGKKTKMYRRKKSIGERSEVFIFCFYGVFSGYLIEFQSQRTKSHSSCTDFLFSRQ